MTCPLTDPSKQNSWKDILQNEIGILWSSIEYLENTRRSLSMNCVSEKIRYCASLLAKGLQNCQVSNSPPVQRAFQFEKLGTWPNYMELHTRNSYFTLVKWNWNLRSSFKKTKYILWALRVKMSLLGIKRKLFIIQNWFFECCRFFYLKHFKICAVPSGGFFKKRITNFNFI